MIKEDISWMIVKGGGLIMAWKTECSNGKQERNYWMMKSQNSLKKGVTVDNIYRFEIIFDQLL